MKKHILGLIYSGAHDSAVSVVSRDGRILMAVEEERLSRHKKDGRWPARCLEHVDLATVDLVCVPYLANDAKVVVEDRPEFAEVAFRRAQAFPDGVPFLSFGDEWTKRLDSLGLPRHHVDHHDAHAASAYYLCADDDVLVITCDSGARNCAWWACAYHGKGGRLQPLLRIPIATWHPVCDGYSHITAVLGFRPMRHEGKITGLAAFGRPDARCRDAVERAIREIHEFEPPLARWVNFLSERTPPTLEVNTAVAAHFRAQLSAWSREDIAASAQAYLEERVLRFVELARELCGAPHVALAGGAFANVRLNQKVLEAGFRSAFVCPPMTDDGLAIGAVLHYLGENEGLAPRRQTSMFLGPEGPPDEVEAAVRRLGVDVRPSPAIHDEIAARLEQGKTVARWTGRMEFGPRALGHRTIYYRADDPTCQEWLNDRLQRTEFMPFAPCTLASEAQRLYRNLAAGAYAAEFMTICFDCTQELKAQSPAVVHVDGTARPQLVTPERNPDMHAVLSAYHRRTGIPTLINTSFNIHDEPIVGSAEDAIDAFLESELDCLAIGDYLLDLESCRHLTPRSEVRKARRLAVTSAQSSDFASLLANDLLELSWSARSQLAELGRSLEQERARALELAASMRPLREQVDAMQKALEAGIQSTAELERELASHRANLQAIRSSLAWRGLKRFDRLRAWLTGSTRKTNGSSLDG